MSINYIHNLIKCGPLYCTALYEKPPQIECTPKQKLIQSIYSLPIKYLIYTTFTLVVVKVLIKYNRPYFILKCEYEVRHFFISNSPYLINMFIAYAITKSGYFQYDSTLCYHLYETIKYRILEK